MKPSLAAIAALAALAALAACTQTSYTGYVDPYIGSGGHGHVFVGANRPFGLVQLGPSNINQSWDWCSGYHFSDSVISGFPHTHLSGTGIGDLGDICFMPVVGNPVPARGSIDSGYKSGRYSLFSHDSESVRPGFYSVHLSRYGIDVELTATARVGFHRYTFPEAADAKIIIDLSAGQGWDTPVEGMLVQENDTVVSGYRYSTGWAARQRIYFTAVFSKPVEAFEYFSPQVNMDTVPVKKAKRLFGIAHLATKKGEQVLVKVALSPVSISGAKANMAAELPHWSFEKTAAEADAAWNAELGKIKIETGSEATRRTFYTALYHTMIAPSVFCDVNGDYCNADGNVHTGAAFKSYTTFSLWDTYRAAHPLMSIIQPEKMSDIIGSMLAIYQAQGRLPVWHLMGNETDCMVGNPGVPVVADALLKGFDTVGRGFNRNLAYIALRNTMMGNDRGLDLLKKYGYIPYDKGQNEALSKCMEYAIADWSVAQAAQRLGFDDDYRHFLERSKAYRYYFDPATGFVRGRAADGAFRSEPLNPCEARHRDNDYTEGNAWQYTFLVPHDVQGLAELFGGREAMLQKLDSLFSVSCDLGEHASPDITGLIGQYAHGNEPSHHIAYLYAMLGQPHKTADRVRQILATMYSNQPDGLSGNEDVGQMSAWYVLSALGMYQVEPAGGRYVLGSPIVDKASICVGNGKFFTINVRNNAPDHRHIKSAKINGADANGCVMFADIAKGGTLDIEME